MSFIKDENGQGMLEYVLIIAIVAVIAIVALVVIKNCLLYTSDAADEL